MSLIGDKLKLKNNALGQKLNPSQTYSEQTLRVVSNMNKDKASNVSTIQQKMDNLWEEEKQTTKHGGAGRSFVDNSEIIQQQNPKTLTIAGKEYKVADSALPNQVMLTDEQRKEIEKKAPLSIDKIRSNIGKIKNTAEHIIGSGVTGAMQGAEGLVQEVIGTGGNFLEKINRDYIPEIDTKNITKENSKRMINQLVYGKPTETSEKIKKTTEELVGLNVVDEAKERLDKQTKELYGKYNPEVLGVPVSNIASEAARMVTLAPTGLPGFMASAAGGNISEAINEGEELDNAVRYGAVSGAIEGGTEKMFDTFNIVGGGVIDKFLPKSAIGKFITGSLGEGVEEIVNEAVNPFVKMATYEGEVDNPVSSSEAFDNYVDRIKDAGWQGFVMGMFMQGAHDISDSEVREQYKAEVSNAVEKVKGLTENQKKQMIDKLVNASITSSMQLSEMENYMNQYKNTSEYSKYIPTNQNFANNITFNNEKTSQLEKLVPTQKNDALQSAQNEPNDTANQITPTEGKTAQNGNMEQTTQGDKVMDVLLGKKAEKAQNPVQIKAEETLTSAKQAGMTDIDINKATELNNLLQSNARLQFYDENNLPQGFSEEDMKKVKVANGLYSNGTIYINKNSKNVVEKILGHELTHHLETTGSFNDLANTILDSDVFYEYMTEKGFQNVQAFKQSLLENGYAEQQLDNEIVARFVEDNLFSNQDRINRLARSNATLAEKIKNFISDLKVKLKGTAQEKQLLKIEVMYRKALEQARNTETQNNKSNVLYSIKENENGKYVQVDTDQDIFEGVAKEEYNKIAKMYMQDYLKGETRLADNDKVKIGSQGISKYTNPKQQGKYKSEKMQLSTELKNALEIAKKVDDSPPTKDTSKFPNWEYYKVNFEINGIQFEGLINIGIDKDGNKHFYEINKIHNTSNSYVSTSKSNVMDSNNSINQNDSSVNTQYSLDKQNDTAGKEPAFSMTKNPVEIAKNPPNIETGLDQLQRTKRIKEGDTQSSFAKNVLNQNIFDDKFKDLALDDKNIRSYDRITNKETLQKANDAINEQGQKWVDRFKKKASGEMKAEDIAGGFILMNRYQQVGDYESMISIAEKLRKAGTQQGQTIQMFSVLGRMTPEGMTYYAQKTLSEAYDEILKNKAQAWADEHADDFKLTEKDIEFIQRRVKQASKLPEGRDKYVLLGEIAERIQSKIPPQPGQSTKALARISMLLNSKTIIRNILGNIVIVPNHIVSDFIGSAIDKNISKKTGVRTTGAFTMQALTGIKKGVYESFDDFRRGISTRDLGTNRYEIQQTGKSFNENHTGKFSAQRNKLNKALNGLDRVTGFLLETGDRPIYETWFINSLNNQMKLNNLTEPTAEMIEIATDEALQRTWQDNNTYTKVVSGIRNGLNKLNVKGYGLGDVVMPFVKTPANLTKSVVDFSPLGAINAAIKTSRFNKDIGKGVATSKQQREVVKAWSQVITGSLGMAIMTALANAGILAGGSDEDKDVRNFEQNVLGIKPYSIKIGDKTFTYDWAQPLGTSAAIVADTVKSLKDSKETEGKVSAILNGLESGTSVLLEQSFVSGIRNLFEEDNLINALIESMANEPAKFTPQFLSQIAQLQDDTARITYVYNDKIATGINKVKAKIPGLRETLEPGVDVLGREVKTDNSALNVLLNPTNTGKTNSIKEAEEMYKVYKETGDKAAIAPVAPYYITVDKEKIVLSPKQRTEYQKTTGQIALESIDNLLKNSSYAQSKPEEKAEVLKEVYSYANSVAKSEVSNYELSTLYQDIQNSGANVADVLLAREIANSKGTSRSEQTEALINNGYSKAQATKFLDWLNKTTSATKKVDGEKVRKNNYLKNVF